MGHLACLALPATFAIDLVKMPVVVLGHGIFSLGNLANKKRFFNYLYFLINPKEKEKLKRISRIDYRAINNTLY